MDRTDKITPDYAQRHPWESYSKALATEYRQCLDEGRDVYRYNKLFDAIAGLPDSEGKDKLADTLFDMLQSLPQTGGYPYIEPSSYDEILKECVPVECVFNTLPKDMMLDKIRGAVYGRICGCLLGKPVEGMRRDQLISFLKESGNYPMTRYIGRSDVENIGEYFFPIRQRVYDDGQLSGMPVDDDTNYIILALMTILKYKRSFTPGNVAELWVNSQPKNAYCTAERVAFRNFVDGFLPPYSAVYKNPFREWIGAQIRGDLFGWICPGDPKTAALYAWKDASISHVKNGIYGEMFVSAMLAAAGAGAGIRDAIKIGISYIPRFSRLYRAVNDVIACFDAGKTSDEFFADFLKQWNDTVAYDWCHTIPNAEIVTAALLWGNGDYGKTVCLAVQQGFDTDCNGATAGSVVGMVNGFSGIDRYWTSKISGTLFTSIFGYEKVDVDALAQQVFDLI